MNRSRAPIVVLGLLTAIQAGTAIWRIVVMFQEALKFGPTPFILSAGVLEEIGISAGTALVAWWWLPKGDRSATSWAIRFLTVAWLLALGQMGWVLVRGYFEHGFTWVLLAVFFLVGTLLRSPGPPSLATPSPDQAPRRRHPALIAAAIFWLLQIPHLFFPYHWTDTKDIWACRTVAFEHRGDLSGIFDCLDPGRPPLHSLLLWLGHTNGTMEGRLLPFLMVGAFGLVLYHLLRQVAPRLAPWGILWFFMTVRVYQGSVSNYADVATMVAITIALVLAADERLVHPRGMAIALAVIAAMSAALIKRDGGALLLVGTLVIVWFAPRRLEPRLYGAALGALLGLGIWGMRPRDLYVPDVYAPVSAIFQPAGQTPPGNNLPVRWATTGQPASPLMPRRTMPDESVGDSAASDSTKVTAHTYLTMLYGMQGQMLSHYGYCMFVPGWIILAIWIRIRRIQFSRIARLWGWLAVAGWLAIMGMYFVHVSTGHPERGTLLVIRTAFGRHLLHMFAFALLSAAAFADGLVGWTHTGEGEVA
jgi:hypothetical protein